MKNPHLLWLAYLAVFAAAMLASAGLMHMARVLQEDAWMTIGVPALVVMGTALLWRISPTNNP
jgi:hypothetical protein